jgi:hypothetical protein
VKPRWIPPPVGRMNVNVGVALSKTSSTGAVATIAMDENGMFLGALAIVCTSVLTQNS